MNHKQPSADRSHTEKYSGTPSCLSMSASRATLSLSPLNQSKWIDPVNVPCITFPGPKQAGGSVGSVVLWPLTCAGMVPLPQPTRDNTSTWLLSYRGYKTRRGSGWLSPPAIGKLYPSSVWPPAVTQPKKTSAPVLRGQTYATLISPLGCFNSRLSLPM